MIWPSCGDRNWGITLWVWGYIDMGCQPCKLTITSVNAITNCKDYTLTLWTFNKSWPFVSFWIFWRYLYKSNQTKTNNNQTQTQPATNLNQTDHHPFLSWKNSPSKIVGNRDLQLTEGLRFCRLVGMRPYIFKAPKRKTWRPANRIGMECLWRSPQQKQGEKRGKFQITTFHLVSFTFDWDSGTKIIQRFNQPRVTLPQLIKTSYLTGCDFNTWV